MIRYKSVNIYSGEFSLVGLVEIKSECLQVVSIEGFEVSVANAVEKSWVDGKAAFFVDLLPDQLSEKIILGQSLISETYLIAGGSCSTIADTASNGCISMSKLSQPLREQALLSSLVTHGRVHCKEAHRGPRWSATMRAFPPTVAANLTFVLLANAVRLDRA